MSSFIPMNEAVLAGGLSLFTKVATIITGFVSVIFMMRLSYLVVKIAPVSEYGDLFKDSATFFALVTLYPVLIKLIIFSISDIALKISFIPAEENQKVFQNFINRLLPDYPLFIVFGSLGDVIILGLANSIYSAFISLLLASGPVFLFLATLLNMQSGLKTYFGLLISLSLWPIMWNIMGHLSLHVGGQFNDNPVSAFCFYVVILVLQFLSPLFTFGLFKSMSLSTGVTKVISWGRMIG